MSSTPEPSQQPKVMNFRLPPAVAQQVRVKIATDAETQQALYETFTRAWLAGLIDPAALRAALEQQPPQ